MPKPPVSRKPLPRRSAAVPKPGARPLGQVPLEAPRLSRHGVELPVLGAKPWLEEKRQRAPGLALELEAWLHGGGGRQHAPQRLLRHSEPSIRRESAMLNVSKLLPRGQGLSPVLLKRASEVVLDWDTRQKSRFDATDSLGRALAVFLPRGKVVRGGDVLVAEDGSMVRVVAEAQAVMAVTACTAHGSPLDLLRAAYHLGNRHVALQVAADRLQFEPDPVLADMLRRQHLIVTEELAAFEPEGGAYETASGHGHGHGHHDHDDGPAHPHEGHADTPVARPAIPIRSDAHDHDHGHVHVHGPDCQHDH